MWIKGQCSNFKYNNFNVFVMSYIHIKNFYLLWPSFKVGSLSNGPRIYSAPCRFFLLMLLSYTSHTYVKINSQKSLSVSHSDVFSDPNRISTKTIDGRWKGENRSGIKWWTRRRMLSERTCGPHIYSLKLWTHIQNTLTHTYSIAWFYLITYISVKISILYIFFIFLNKNDFNICFVLGF